MQNPTIPNATAVHAGTYTVTATAGICVNSSSTNVTIASNPSAPIASSNSPVCEGERLELQVQNIPGATYSWIGPSGFNSSSQNPDIDDVTTANAGAYTVSATVGNCSSASTLNVSITEAPPPPTASSNGPVCTGDNIELQAAPIPGATYNWSGPDGFTSSLRTPSVPNATVAKAGTYSVTATVNGCISNPSSTEVNVAAAPSTPTASNNSPVCVGTTINLTAASISGASYSWSGPNSFTASVQNPSIPNATLARNGTYTVTATIGNCSNSSSTAVVVNSNPTLVIADPTGVNEPNTVDITAPEITAGSSAGTLTYWTNAAATTSLPNPDAIPTTGTYYIKLTNASGCLTIRPVDVFVNRKPISTGIPALVVDEDQIVPNIDLYDYFSDPENGNNLTFSIRSISVSGILNASISGNTLSIVLIENQSGTTSITIRATDNSNAFIDDVMEIVVNPVNDLPTSENKTITIDENTTYTFDPSDFAFEDVETPELLAISVVTLPSKGMLSLSGVPIVAMQQIPAAQISNLSFTPDTDGFGNPYTSFLFAVSDGTDDSDPPNTITFIINPVNKPPTIDDIENPEAIDEDAPQQTVLLTGITAGRESEVGQEITITAVSDNQELIPNSSIQVSYVSPQTTASLTYLALPNQFGTAIITVTVMDDGEVNNITEKQFTITVNPVADTPSVTDAVANGDEQTASGLVISKNPVDGPEVKYYKITDIANGTLYLNDGTTQILDGQFITIEEGENGLKFTPTAGNSNNGSFRIQAATNNTNDALGGAVISAFILRNSFPFSSGFEPLIVDEDASIDPIDLYDIFSDPDHAVEELEYDIVSISNPDLFSNVEIIDHILLITLNQDSSGIAQITIRATDPYGASVSDVLDITVNPVNDAPRLITPPITLGTQNLPYEYDIEFVDPESDPFTIVLVELPDWLTFSNNGDGTANISGTPQQEQVDINHAVSFYAFDSEQDTTFVSYTLYVQNVNDAPIITSVPDTIAEIGRFYEYTVVAFDDDPGDVLKFEAEFLDGSNLFLNLIDYKDGTATIFGTPPSGTIGTYRIKIVVKDLALDSAVQVYTLKIQEPNGIPQLSNFFITTDEDVPYNFSTADFTTRFSDPDGDTLVNILIVEEPTFGRLVVNEIELSDGDTIQHEDINRLIYLPKENDFNNDFFRWNASDGKDFALIPSNVNVIVNPVPDAPEILDFESEPLFFEYANTEGVFISGGTVFDGDGDNIATIVISISDNYNRGEDVLTYDEIIVAGLTYMWNDTTGVLTISGIKNTTDYTAALQAVKYENLKALSPTISPRQIEILITDVTDLISIPYTREIVFEDTYVELDIPGGFTPNGDSMNDTWNIENLTRYDDYQIIVYSRMGLKVYESRDYSKEWDGTFNGALVPGGVYYYTISVFEFQRKYTGTVTILR